MLVWANSSTTATAGLRARTASTSISSKTVPLYSSFLRGIASSLAASSAVALRPWLSTTAATTSSPRVARRMASLNMEYVLPTPGAYPKNSFRIPCDLVGSTSCSHCSGVFCIVSILRAKPSIVTRRVEFSREANCANCALTIHRDVRRIGGSCRSRTVFRPESHGNGTNDVAGGVVRFRLLGASLRPGSFDRRHRRVQLLLSSAHLYLYDRRPAELVRPHGISGDGAGGRQPVGACPSRGRGSQTAAARGGAPLRPEPAVTDLGKPGLTAQHVAQDRHGDVFCFRVCVAGERPGRSVSIRTRREI